MGHTIKGQSPHKYRPSVGRRTSSLGAISELPSPSTRTAPKRRFNVPKRENLGFNYEPANLIALLKYNVKAHPAMPRTSGNAPNLGTMQNRKEIQNLVASARAKYQNAKKNEVRRMMIARQFIKNHAIALKRLKNAHIQMMRNLNAEMKGANSPNTRLARLLSANVAKLKATLRKN
jgi:hypothetical protein